MPSPAGVPVGVRAVPRVDSDREMPLDSVTIVCEGGCRGWTQHNRITHGDGRVTYACAPCGAERRFGR